MARKRTCQKCGAEVGSRELHGLCPACVAQIAFLEGDGRSDYPCDLPIAGLRRFGNYELIEEIARGGMGVVFKARQTTLNRVVAVKMILTGQLASPAEVQRFLGEAEAAAQLQHPNIVAIHEIGQEAGHYYFSMDYVEGTSLEELVTGPADHWDSKRTAEVIKTIAEAVHFAHEKGLLHRDLKPSNILIDQHGNPRITDFGLARRIRQESRLTVTGQILGSPNFMSPEQAGAHRGLLAPQSDVYSIGAILYCLLAGQPPFGRASPHEILRKVVYEEPLSPRTINPKVPRDLERVCLQCLQKKPRDRYLSARALAEELGRFLRGESVLARPLSPAEKLRRVIQRYPARTALISLALCLIVAAPLRSLIHPGIPNMPVLVGTGISGVINDKLYVHTATDGYEGYRNYLHAYDPALNSWVKLRDSPLAAGRCAAGVLGGKLYLAGGFDLNVQASRQCLVFDPRSNSWSFKTSMRLARESCAGAILGGKLFVVGGTGTNGALASVEAYDPTLDSWSDIHPMHTTRTGAGAAVVKNKLYVIGGATIVPADCSTNSVEVYDPSTGRWTFCAPLPRTRGAPFVVAMDGRIYVAGGGILPGKVRTGDDLQVYSPEDNRWEVRRPMPSSSFQGAGAQVFQGKIWCIGGWTTERDNVTGRELVAHDEIFIYDPRRNTWSTSGRTR